MSQESERPGPLSPTAPVSAKPFRDVTPAPLAAVVDVVSASGLGVERSDIDALIAAMEHPLSPDEPPRARADLLLRLLARNNRVGDLEGTGGVQVRRAAREALLALGPPHALELPGETPSAAPSTPVTPTAGTEGPGRGHMRLLLGSAGYQTVFLVVAALLLLGPGTGRSTGHQLSEFNVLWLAFIWLDVLVLMLGYSTQSRRTRIIAKVGLWLQFVGWAGLTLVLCGTVPPFIPLVLLLLPWHLTLYSALKLGLPSRARTAPQTP